jgi:DNA-binding response OmpR family regulator
MRVTRVTLCRETFDMSTVVAIFDASFHRMSIMPVVLFVDDEAPMRRVVQHALTRHDIEVHTAGSLAEARRACQQHAFDGAIIDVWLDDGSGFELFAWLQEHYPRVARNTLFVTGDIAASADVGRQLRAVGRPVLVKPFDFDELEDLIQKFSRTSGSLPSLPEARPAPEGNAR